jgi:hypothetical protein
MISPALRGSFGQERLGAAVLADELDFHIGGIGDADGFLVREEVVLAHGADGGLRIGGPLAHRVRVPWRSL